MRELIYAMCFTGRATPVGSAGGVFAAATTAPSSRLASTVGPDGLTGGLSPAQGGTATFASEVTCTSETGFQEVGTITFGAGNVVRFSTVGSGNLRTSADLARKHGAVLWRVDGGEGQFSGATGLITSNFLVGDSLEITDHQFGVLLLP